MSALSLLMPAARAQADTSLAGVHWYSGDSSLLDLTVPAGERGYNVEVIFDAGWCDGNPSTDPGGVRSVAATAKAHGLVNIIRVDYRQLLAVPTNPGEYGSWAANFIKCTQELSDLSSLFIVGNEPNIEDGGRPEGDIRSDEYASAFNYLYARKADLPAGTQLLATFDSPFTSPAWMLDMSSRLIGVDGFALHTGGVRTGCRDPRQPCSFGGWSFDGAFRYYRDVIANINSGWWSRPVYITEFNTYTGEPGSEPDRNYPPDWINQAFEEIRNYNATRGARPLVKALCWFVDRPQSWPKFSLRNLAAARADMGEEFKNPANRGGGGTCTRGRPRVQYAREYWVVDSRASLAQFQEIVRQAYPSRVTVGFSYDDAGIGDLDTRKVVVWGDEFDRNVLLDWYRQNYGGVSVEFRALPGQGSWRFGPYATPAPAGCRGEPRIQYAREYWVIDSRAPLPTVLGIAEQAYRDRRQTVGFSYDDAGIGDLDQRQVVVWGNEFDPSVLRQWYAQFYPGVTLTFRGSDRIERRVVVLSYDPVNPTNPAEHLSNRLGTADVFEHSQRIADAIRAASGFMADYQIVETHRIDKFPVKRDGFRYTWDGYLACHGNAANCHSPDDASYRPMMNGEDAGTDLCGRIASGQIDEVWLWGFGWFGLDEFAYKIPNDQPLFQPRPYNYWIYDGRKKDLPVCGRTYFVMGYNHERQEGRGLHSFGHRMESALIASPVGQGLWQRCGSTQYGSSDWTDFTCIERDAPGRAGCGDVHNPPNATQDYDYANPTPVTSQCDDWFNYPNRTGATTTVSYSTWGRAPWGSDEDGYFTWWMNHVPRKPGGGAALYNWWHYILCYDRTCR